MIPCRSFPSRRRFPAGLVLLVVALFCLMPLGSRPVLAGSGPVSPTPQAATAERGPYGFGFATLRDTPTPQALPLAQEKVASTPTPAGLGPSETYSVTNGMIFGAGILLLLVVVGFLIGLGQSRREQ